MHLSAQALADSETTPPGDPHWYPKVSTLARAPITVPAAVSEEQLDLILTGRATFSFHFQPIVDLQRGLVAGFEALARFSAAGNRVAPNLVFEAAGTYGRRLELEEKVLTEAIAANRLLPPNTFLSVNVGPNYLLSDRFDHVLAHAPSLRGVVFEITEDEVITDYSILHRKLALIRQRGGFAAVDDAGSGYSSLKHIMEIRPNFIKLDRSFINGCNAEPAKAVLIDMIGKAANRLDAWIIAEGIENADELDQLIRLSVPLGQGFFLARPEPVMRMLQQDQVASILSRVEAQVPTPGIQRTVENCIICRERDEAYFRLRNHTGGGIAVVCDAGLQPLEILENHSLLGIRSLPQIMKVQESSEGIEILHRALTRPAHLRFDPLIVVNERGELVGVVHLDRLIREIIGS